MTEEPPIVQDVRVSPADAKRLAAMVKKDETEKTISVERHLRLKQELLDVKEVVAKYEKAEAKRVETQRQELLKTFSEDVQKEYKKSTLEELEKLIKVLGQQQP